MSANDPIMQPFSMVGQLVPGFWRYIFPAEFASFRLPAERQATCRSCPKARFEGWRPDYRCCTYLPRVPNFLLGLALGDSRAACVIPALNERGFLIPEGFFQSPKQWLDYLIYLGDDSFGRGERILCPLLERETGLCKIYAFRNAVCSTFFCHHDHGKRGERFWDSLQATVTQVEMALSQWALETAGFDFNAYINRMDTLAKDLSKTIDQTTGGWSLEARRLLWGEHFGRELALFQRCGELVSAERERLWEIANSHPIKESKAFDKACLKTVPRRYRDQIDPDDFKAGDPAKPAELWKDLKRAYTALWRLPKGRVALSPRATLATNERQDAMGCGYADKSHVVSYFKRRGGKAIDWQKYVSGAEAEALQLFAKPQRMGPKLLAEPRLAAAGGANNQSVEAFLAEWHGKGVLVEVP